MRKESLNWWNSLSFNAKALFTHQWQKQLGTDFMRGWSFPFIDKSDSAIQRIYEWHLIMKTKPIDPDILTDKRY